VLPRAQRRGYGRALTLAALARARDLGCANVTLNATAEGELLYRSVGFRSLGLGHDVVALPPSVLVVVPVIVAM
jgi:ribosomal protein S18 acetylase RimI-like enzyme